jgi:aspartate kinase
MMKIVVQKFGGTSMAKQDTRLKAIEKVIKAKSKGYAPVVVVSAIGRKGDPYSTDTLIDFAHSVNYSIPSRELDLIMSCGEIISAVIMANTLTSKGYQAMALTGWQAGIVTDDNFGNAAIMHIKTDKIIDILNRGYIPVIAGFQGITQDGDITTLGRGGSDTTAVVIGEGLSAELVEIYTDVDGIMTADPRIVPDAVVLNQISYSEVFQIADQGAKVIHPRAVEIAMRSNIPIAIKNTMNEKPGTIVSAWCKNNAIEESYDPECVITSIAHITNRTQVTIEKVDDESQNRILSLLAENDISIDLINIFPDKMIFTIDGNDTSKATKILDENSYNYSFIINCSKISAVGNRMRGIPGVMAKIISALSKYDIKVLQTADSHTTISCLVRGEDTEKAVTSLHMEFNLCER